MDDEIWVPGPNSFLGLHIFCAYFCAHIGLAPSAYTPPDINNPLELCQCPIVRQVSFGLYTIHAFLLIPCLPTGMTPIPYRHQDKGGTMAATSARLVLGNLFSVLRLGVGVVSHSQCLTKYFIQLSICHRFMGGPDWLLT